MHPREDLTLQEEADNAAELVSHHVVLREHLPPLALVPCRLLLRRCYSLVRQLVSHRAQLVLESANAHLVLCTHLVSHGLLEFLCAFALCLCRFPLETNALRGRPLCVERESHA